MPRACETESARLVETTSSPSKCFHFLAGDPSLDFVNTVDSWLSDTPSDALETYQDLVDWSGQVGLVCPEVAASLRKAASECEQDAERVLRRAHTFRERLYKALVASVSGESPRDADLNALTSLIRNAAAHSRLDRCGNGFAWILDDARGCELDWPIWQLARATVDLLTSDSLQRVRQCAEETCGWLFVDQSRNRSRRWCDMSSCGNRAKARRNYARKKAQRLAEQG
ncbi:CGNR zinc finger domain-containing protein [Candidatus Bipolaricaulota bacterium]